LAGGRPQKKRLPAKNGKATIQQKEENTVQNKQPLKTNPK
jgi:hypothetical protein